jgi:protein-disulfide isomerase
MFWFFWGIFLNHFLLAKPSNINSLPFFGEEDSPLVIVDFFDYKCVFCRKIHKILDQFQRENPKAKIIYRPLPLSGVEGKKLAKAALAANFQGKFHPMHCWLMEKGYKQDEKEILATAESFGINKVQFKIDFEGKEIEEIVDNNIVFALKNNIRTVPGIILNNHLLNEFIDYKEFIQAVQQSIIP